MKTAENITICEASETYSSRKKQIFFRSKSRIFKIFILYETKNIYRVKRYKEAKFEIKSNNRLYSRLNKLSKG